MSSLGLKHYYMNWNEKVGEGGEDGTLHYKWSKMERKTARRLLRWQREKLTKARGGPPQGEKDKHRLEK